MPLTRKTVIDGGAPMAREVVADLLSGTRPEDLAGYIVIGLMRQPAPGGFKIASNATDDDAEILLLEYVVRELRKARIAGGGS